MTLAIKVCLAASSTSCWPNPAAMTRTNRGLRDRSPGFSLVARRSVSGRAWERRSQPEPMPAATEPRSPPAGGPVPHWTTRRATSSRVRDGRCARLRLRQRSLPWVVPARLVFCRSCPTPTRWLLRLAREMPRHLRRSFDGTPAACLPPRGVLRTPRPTHWTVFRRPFYWRTATSKSSSTALSSPAGCIAFWSTWRWVAFGGEAHVRRCHWMNYSRPLMQETAVTSPRGRHHRMLKPCSSAPRHARACAMPSLICPSSIARSSSCGISRDCRPMRPPLLWG